MAQTWLAKAPTEVVERRWSVPLDACDSISSVAVVGTGVTVDSDDHDGGDAIVTLSAGTNGVEATVTVTVTTSEGNTLVETFFIAIRATTAAFTTTVQDVVSFALRKIIGAGETATSDELADGVELFNGMIATWRMNGQDIGIAGELASTDTIDVPDEFILPLKFCLRRLCYATYGAELSMTDAQMAEQGERLIANRLFEVTDLAMPATLTRRYPWVTVPI